MGRWKLCGWALVLMVTMVVTGDGRAEPAKVDAPVKKVAKAAAGAGETDAATRDAVRAVLRAQVDAWNRGDINAFMDHYWKSDNLTFSSRGKTTRGWQATLDSYRKRYPTREKMGRLKLDGLEITPLGDTSAMVLGGWKVDRANEPVGGNFTLVLRKIDGRWVIVHDHTSRLEE